MGPNGSGKTTLLGIVLDIIKASSGEYRWFGGMASPQGRKKIGALIETPNFYPYLTAKQNLTITAGIKNQDGSDIDKVLDLLNLSDKKNDLYSTYSLGMKQRLAIAASLIGNPEILVLDEPTNALDPVGITDLRNLIKMLHNEGKTIILASHLLDEIEKLCTDVAILQKGKLIAAGKVDVVLTNEDVIQVGSNNLAELLLILQNFPDASKVIQEEKFVKIFFAKGKADPEQVFQYCCKTGIVLNHLQVYKKSVEASFFELLANN